jgi:uncharacterized protein (TIGR02271 family)
MEREYRSDGFTGLEDSYAGYTVYDMHYEKIGKVDDLFIDENDRPEYIGVKMGFLGTKSTLIPIEIVRINERRQLMEVSQPKEKVKDAPTFSDDKEITPEFEREVRAFFGVESAETIGGRGSYGAYDHGTADEDSSRYEPERNLTGEERRAEETRDEERPVGERPTPTTSRERRETQDERGRGLGDEIRVQRSEEVLRAVTREREAGDMRVRKRVRTDRESFAVPKKREEVKVERVPVEESQGTSEANRETSGVRMEDDEIVVPIIEEEIVVEKRPVIKEEIRIRKSIVEEEEVVEEDVRKEEVDIDDQTTTRRDDRG